MPKNIIVIEDQGREERAPSVVAGAGQGVSPWYVDFLGDPDRELSCSLAPLRRSAREQPLEGYLVAPSDEELAEGNNDFRSAVGVDYVGARASGDGACGLHALFGDVIASGELKLAAAREALRALIAKPLSEVRARLSLCQQFDNFITTLWDEFLSPIARRELGIETPDPGREAHLFWSCAQSRYPDLITDTLLFWRQAGYELEQFKRDKQQHHEYCKHCFFVEQFEGALVQPLARLLHLLPATLPDTHLT
jgi:hypothetical protein